MSDPIERWDEESDIVPHARKLLKFPFLDEFIAENVDVHYEAMGHAQFWMLITCRETGRQWHLNVGAVSSRVKGYAMVEEDSAALKDRLPCHKPRHEARQPSPLTMIGKGPR